MGSGELQTLGSGNGRACLLVKLEITPANRGAACRVAGYIGDAPLLCKNRGSSHPDQLRTTFAARHVPGKGANDSGAQ